MTKIDGASLNVAQTPVPSAGGFELTSHVKEVDRGAYENLLYGTTNERVDMTDEPSAARTLDIIRQGGSMSLLTVRQRLNEGLTMLDGGEFGEAYGRISEAQQYLAPLANAERAFCVAAGSYVIRAAELETGMVMSQVGPITSVERADCNHDACPGHFMVKIEGMDQAIMMEGDSNIYIERDKPETQHANPSEPETND
jgi:hypothetical protein